MVDVNYRDINRKIKDFNRSNMRYKKNMLAWSYNANEAWRQLNELKEKAKIVRYATLWDVLKQAKVDSITNRKAKKVINKLSKPNFWENVESILNPNNK